MQNNEPITINRVANGYMVRTEAAASMEIINEDTRVYTDLTELYHFISDHFSEDYKVPMIPPTMSTPIRFEDTELGDITTEEANKIEEAIHKFDRERVIDAEKFFGLDEEESE